MGELHTPQFSKSGFLAAYQDELSKRYDWAQDGAKLARFLDSVRDTIANGCNTWTHEGEAVTAAWQRIGGKGKPTKKALRALAS